MDTAALQETLKCGGQSIIVLPQGILTFKSGMREYYPHVMAGNVLIVSTFHPRAPWGTALAMARNRYIYGLAQEIYIAQSGESGGTWAGAIDGLKHDRPVYVRTPEPDEQSANALLLEKGAIPVDGDGNICEWKAPERDTPAPSSASSAHATSESVQYELFD